MMEQAEKSRVASMYTSIEPKKTKSTTNKSASVDIKCLQIVKGKKGNLGRGSHGQVKVSHYEALPPRPATPCHAAPRRAAPRQHSATQQRFVAQTTAQHDA